MKRIGALSGMRLLVLSLVSQIGYTVAGAAQETQAESVDSLAVEAESVDSYFLNDRAITRIPTKLGLGALTAVGTGFLSLIVMLPHLETPAGDPGFEGHLTFLYGLLAGYPVGVYLADPVESSFWMTCVGYGLVFGAVVQTKGDNWLEGVLFYGSPIMASELSRLLPKRYRNPNPFKWLFGKFRRPSPRVSFGLVPYPQRGLSVRATQRF